MRTTLTALLLVVMAASAEAASTRGALSAAATGTLRITVPSMNGVRVTPQSTSRGEGTVVTISVFSSSRALIVNRYAPSSDSGAVRVNYAPDRANQVTVRQGGWSTISDSVKSQPKRTGRNAARDEDVIYEIWSF